MGNRIYANNAAGTTTAHLSATGSVVSMGLSDSANFPTLNYIPNFVPTYIASYGTSAVIDAWDEGIARGGLRTIRADDTIYEGSIYYPIDAHTPSLVGGGVSSTGNVLFSGSGTIQPPQILESTLDYWYSLPLRHAPHSVVFDGSKYMGVLDAGIVGDPLVTSSLTGLEGSWATHAPNNPTPTVISVGSRLHYSNGVYLITNNNTCMYSSDGIIYQNATGNPIGTPTDFKTDGTIGIITSSIAGLQSTVTGGAIFTTLTTGTAIDTMTDLSITHNGFVFVVAGHGAAGTAPVVVTSPDGITWTTQTFAPTLTNFYGVRSAAGNVFLLGSVDGLVRSIYYSVDNVVTFTAATAMPIVRAGNTVAMGALVSDGTTTYLDCEGGSVIKTTDTGATWVDIYGPPTGLKQGSAGIVVGPAGIWLASQERTMKKFTTENLIGVQTLDSGTTVAWDDVSSVWVKEVDTWVQHIVPGIPLGGFSDLRNVDNTSRWVGVGAGGVVLYTDDFITWTEAGTPVGWASDMHSVGFHRGIGYAGAAGAKLLRSFDSGISWALSSGNALGDITAIYPGRDSIYCFMQYSSGGVVVGASVTPDGITHKYLGAQFTYMARYMPSNNFYTGYLGMTGVQGWGTSIPVSTLDYYIATLSTPNEDSFEIVKVLWSNLGTALIERALEGTTAKEWPFKSNFGIRSTASSFGGISNLALGTGSLGLLTKVSTSSSRHVVALGYESYTKGGDTTVVGAFAGAEEYGTAIGRGAYAYYQGTAVGYGAGTSKEYGVGIGYDTYCTSYSGIAIGTLLTPIRHGSSAIAIGTSAGGTGYAGANSICIGTSTTSGAHLGLSLGNYATSTAESTVTVGNRASTSGLDATAIGHLSIVGGTRAIGMGRSTASSGVDAMALGSYASASAVNATALGANTSVSAVDAMALGSGAVNSIPYTSVLSKPLIAPSVGNTLPLAAVPATHVGGNTAEVVLLTDYIDLSLIGITSIALPVGTRFYLSECGVIANNGATTSATLQWGSVGSIVAPVATGIMADGGKVSYTPLVSSGLAVLDTEVTIAGTGFVRAYFKGILIGDG